MKLKFRIMVWLTSIVIILSFVGCQQETDSGPDIDIVGRIYYTTGNYSQVDHITFMVEGGKAPYKLYYSRSIDSWDYAWSGRSYIGTCDETVEMTYSVDGYVSTGWYYYIWAVDSNGDKGRARWHP